MSDLVATLEGLDLAGVGEVSPQSFLNPLGAGEGLGGFNPTSNFYVPLDGCGPGGGDEDDQPMRDEPPEEQAERAGRMAKTARTKMHARERSACVMRDRMQKEVARVEALDARVATSPPGQSRERLVRERALAATIAVRAAKTQAVAVVLARDSRRKEALLRQYQSAAKRKDRAGMGVIGAAVRAVQSHEKGIKVVRAAQQAKWKCGNAGFVRSSAQQKLAAANASMDKVKHAQAIVAGKLNRLRNAGIRGLDDFDDLGFRLRLPRFGGAVRTAARATARAAGSPIVSATRGRIEKARLERQQTALDQRHAKLVKAIAHWSARAKDADRPCRAPAPAGARVAGRMAGRVAGRATASMAAGAAARVTRGFPGFRGLDDCDGFGGCDGFGDLGFRIGAAARAAAGAARTVSSTLTTAEALSPAPLAAKIRQKIDVVRKGAEKADGAAKAVSKKAAWLAAKLGKAGAKAGKAAAKVDDALDTKPGDGDSAAPMPDAKPRRGALIIVGLLAAGGAAAYALS